MWRGWLVYDRQRLAKNQWLADHLVKHAPDHGIDLRLVLKEELPQQLPDLAIFRCDALKEKSALEEAGVRCFNNATVSCIAHDKLATLTHAQQRGIPVLRSAPAENPEQFSNEEPVVLKPRRGHGGQGVQLLKPGWRGSLDGLEVGGWMLQEVASEPGKDLRVYVMGGRIIGAYLRQSTGDFRSNFSLGGTATQVDLTGAHQDLVHRVTQGFTGEFIGVDWLFHHGRMVLSEIEDVVGTRMIYASGGEDVFLRYVGFIAAAMQR